MSKSTNRILIIVLIVLLGIYLVSNFLGGDKKRSFDPVICDLDTSQIMDIKIYPKGSSPFNLLRQEEDWVVIFGDDEKSRKPARQSTINSVLAPLAMIEADRIVAVGEDRFNEFAVDEENGSRVEVFQGGEKVADLFIGRLQFDQQARSATTYVRPANEDKVYAVDGFFSTAYNQTADGFRQSKLTGLDPNEVEEIIIQQQNQVRSLVYSSGKWLTEGESPVDSTAVSEYLQSIQQLSGRSFARGIGYEDLTAPTMALEFRGANLSEPIRIEAYRSDTTQRFLLYSTLNPENILLSDSTGVYQKLFPPVADLLNRE